jgi:hypothetical protein
MIAVGDERWNEGTHPSASGSSRRASAALAAWRYGHENGLRRERQVGHAGHESERKAAKDEQDGIGNPKSRCNREHRRDRDGEPKQQSAVVIEAHAASARGSGQRLGSP